MNQKLLAVFATLLIPMLLPFIVRRYGLKVPARKWVVWYIFWIVLASLLVVQIFTIEHVLSVQPRHLDFGETLGEIPMVITNNGSGVIRWEVRGLYQGWLTVNPTSGAVGAERDTVRVAINRSMIPPGNTTARFFVVGRAGENATVWVRVVGSG